MKIWKRSYVTLVNIQVNADPVPSVDDGHDELDFEADEPDKVE